MSIFPFIDSTSTSTETNDELPMLKEYAYDFEKNELLLDEGGRTYMVEGNEALRIWIFKALFTERCHYTAYSFAFGSEIQDQVIGHSMNVEIVKLEIERFIIEALMVISLCCVDRYSGGSTSLNLPIVAWCWSHDDL